MDLPVLKKKTGFWHYDVSAYLIPYCHLVTLFYIYYIYICVYSVVYTIYKYLRIVYICANLPRFSTCGIRDASSVVCEVLVLLYVHVSLVKRCKRFCTDWDYLLRFITLVCSIICLDVCKNDQTIPMFIVSRIYSPTGSKTWNGC